MRVCEIQSCDDRHYARGYCRFHYQSYMQYGDPLKRKRWTRPGEPLKWIEDYANYQGDDCLKWPFQVASTGYGQATFRGKRSSASRVMCIIAHGEPPEENLVAAHICGNGHLGCVNPRHIVWKSHQDNIRDRFLHDTVGANIDYDGTYELDEIDEAFIKKHRDRVLISQMSALLNADPKKIYRALEDNG